MKKLLFYLLFFSFMLMGCNKNKLTQEELILESIQNQFKAVNTIQDDMFQIKLNALEPYELSFVKKVMTAVIVSNATIKNNAYILTLTIPSKRSLQKVMSEDKNGFQVDYKKLIETNMRDSKKKKYVFGYLCNLIDHQMFDTEEIQISVTVRDQEKVIYGAEFLELITDYVDFNYVSSMKLSDDKVSLPNKELKIPEIKVGQSFVSAIDKVKFLISDIRIYNNNDACIQLERLSKLNSEIKVPTNQEILFITYKATNLTKNKLKLKNYFTAVDNISGLIYQNAGIQLIGLQDIAVLKGFDEANFSCCIILPKDAELLWYGDKIQGVYKIIGYE